MSILDTRACGIQCPYCGESIEVVIDPTVMQQSYTEDCSVCCRPISLHVVISSDDEIIVRALREEDC